ncbi:MAG: ATP-binding cassette domain-containing protein [Candidatus Limnocylindria bacterium]
MSAAIVARDLRRTYLSKSGLLGNKRVEREALRGVNLSIERGEIFGLLGPNGAGKTTLVKILATVLLPTAGTAEVAGFDVVRDAGRVRERIGLVFGGERGLHGALNGRDTLRYWGTLHGLSSSELSKRTEELLSLVGLAARDSDRVFTYSRGMKQRLHLARGLIARPEILLLDEPTIGLDPVASREIRALVRQLNEQGTTVFLTTHYMAEAEELCGRVAFLSDGRIVQLASPRELTRMMSELSRIDADLPAGRSAVVAELRGLPGVRGVETTELDGGALRLSISAERTALAQVLAVLARFDVREVATKEPTLEDVYVRAFRDLGMRV